MGRLRFQHSGLTDRSTPLGCRILSGESSNRRGSRGIATQDDVTYGYSDAKEFRTMPTELAKVARVVPPGLMVS